MNNVINRDVEFTWLGHATFRVRTPGGKTLLIDPWVQGNPACPEHLKNVDQCDLMLLTHAHFDHIGDSIAISQRTGAKVIGIVELLSWLGKKGVLNLSPMNKGGTQHFGEISVTMVHADHSCGITDGDQILYGGEAVGYVVTLENGFRFYHAGDTNVFGDMEIIHELYEPELVMIPIGDHFTMSPVEAAKAVQLLRARHVVPMHFGTFPLLTGRPAKLRELTAGFDSCRVYDLEPGDTLS